MRTILRSVLVLLGVGAFVVAGPSGVSVAAANQSYRFAIASVRPVSGQVVGVAHPVVVTFRAPVVNRSAAERAVEVKSAPSMTGKFEWLDSDVVQWVPDRYLAGAQHDSAVSGWPVHRFQDGPRCARCGRHLRPHLHRERRRNPDRTVASTTRSAPPTALGRRRGDAGIDGSAAIPDTRWRLHGDVQRPYGDNGFEQRWRSAHRSRGLPGTG